MENILINLFLISIGGSLGAESRYWITGKLKDFKPLPYGTLFVNILGSFLLGFVLTLSKFGNINNEIILFLGIGFLGCFTTMSSFVVETLTLSEISSRNAIINIILMIIFVLLGAFIGKYLVIFLCGF